MWMAFCAISLRREERRRREERGEETEGGERGREYMEEREGGRRGKEEDREKRAGGGMRAGEGKERVLKIGERGEEIEEREGRKKKVQG